MSLIQPQTIWRNEMKNVNTLAHELKSTANELIDITSKPVETVIGKIKQLLANATEKGKNGLQVSIIRGGRPLALVQYVHPTTGVQMRLGVFWIGISGRTNFPTVGLRKLVKSGCCHRGHRRFAPAYWVEISELASHGNS